MGADVLLLNVQHAMAEILDIEAEAAKLVSMKEGLIELLTMLREKQVNTMGVLARPSYSFSLTPPPEHNFSPPSPHPRCGLAW